MTIYEDKRALPFFAYKVILDEMRCQNPEIYSYMEDRGFVMDERDYLNCVSRTVQHGSTRNEWNIFSKYLEDAHIANIDIFSSELKMLSDNLIDNGRVLYAGVGNGDLVEGMRRFTNAEIVGFDYSKGVLKECGEHGEIILAACDKIPVKDESVDQIFVTGVGWNDKRVKELKRTLAHGGEIIFDFSRSISLNTSGVITGSYEDYIRSFIKAEGLREHVNRRIISKMKSGAILQYPDMKDDIAFLKRRGLKKRFIFSDVVPLPRPLNRNQSSFDYNSGNFVIQIALAGKKP
ncbi:MAG: methyltransferase domain-containing protein [Candidatus Aenigmatarchaeota archaeon]